MTKRLIALVGTVIVLMMPSSAPFAQQQTAGKAILAGALAKLDIKEAQIEPGQSASYASCHLRTSRSLSLPRPGGVACN